MWVNTAVQSKTLRQAHAALWAGSWDAAISAYRQAAEADPEDARAALFLAQALWESGRPDDALVHYENAARLLPDEAAVIEKIALIHQRKAENAPAIACFEKAAALFAQAGQPQRAAGCWQHILQLDPEHNQAQQQLADIGRGGNVSRPELADLLEDTQPAPGEAGSQETDPPQSPLEKAQKTAGKNLAALFFDYGKTLLMSAPLTPDEAGENPGGLRNLSADPACLKVLGHISLTLEYLARGLPERSLTELQALPKAGVKNPAVHYLAGALLCDKNPSQAAGYLKHTRTIQDYALASFLLLGKMLYREEKYADAASAYLRALAVADSAAAAADQSQPNPVTFKPFVQAYAKEKNTAFLKTLCETIEEEVNRSDWLNRLARLHAQISARQPSGNTLLAEVLAAGGSPLVERFAGVQELEKENMPRSAVEEVYDMIDDGPVLLPAQLVIAENLARQGRVDDAVEKFSLIATLYLLRGQLDQAVQTLEQGVQAAPLNVPIRRQLVDMLKKQANIKPAAENLVKLAEIYYQLAEPAKSHHALAEAISLTLSAPAFKPLSVTLLHQQAALYTQDLQFQQAILLYEKILALNPLDIAASVRAVALQFRLGNYEPARQKMAGFLTYLSASRKAELAEEYLKGLVAELPEAMEFRKSLADFYYKRGSLPQAIEQLEIIARQLMQRGKNTAALAVLKTIISLNPPDVEKYRQYIQHLGAQPQKPV
jgi:tetratricopeptide (TPR) repeat protein